MNKAKLTISKPITNTGEEYINIRIGDKDAGIEFLELKIELVDFTKALMGLAHTECEMEFRGLKNVGKKIERNNIEFEINEKAYASNRKEIACKLAEKATPDGWEFSEHFGSQNSFFTKDGKGYARTSIFRWVEK